MDEDLEIPASLRRGPAARTAMHANVQYTCTRRDRLIRVRLGFAGEMFLAAKALKRVHCETPLPSGARVITRVPRHVARGYLACIIQFPNRCVGFGPYKHEK